MGVKIIWIWTCLGNKVVSEKEVCETAGKEAWFLNVRTELTNVFYLEKNQGTVEDMFVDAILNALIDARLTVDDIDGIFVSHSWSHGDKVISLSAILATRLWLNIRRNIIAKDINAACVGFGDALDTAFQQIKNDGQFNHKNYIVVAWDNLWSGQRDMKDIKTWMFSDGAWCMIISNYPDYSSMMEIEKTASWLSKGVNINNVCAISQPEWKKLWMNDGKELSSSLLGTADEIFSVLGIRNLESGTLIIPHQPNNKMLKKWEDNSKVISHAKEKWKEIEVHNDTYKTMGNLTGASVVFWLQKAIKEWLLPKWCKHIILAPFWAGWHIAWAEIKYSDPYKKTFGIIPKIGVKAYKNASKYTYEANEKIFWANAPISYKKNIAGRLVPNVFAEGWMDRFIPQQSSIAKVISSIDIFHWQALRSLHPDKEFVTKSIYYELPKSEDDRTSTFHFNGQKISWTLKIDEVKKIWATKSWKDIYQLVTLKDGVKFISEFCEIPPMHIDDINKYKDITKPQKWTIRKIESDDVNVHWSIWWYVSTSLLLEDKISKSAIIEFTGWAKYWDTVSIQPLNKVSADIKIPSKYTKENNPDILCVVNEDTKSLVTILTPNVKLHEDKKNNVFVAPNMP